MSKKNWARSVASRYPLDSVVGTPFFRSAAAMHRTNWYFNWDLHMVADEFTDMTEEVHAIRNNVAIGDMSPLTKIEVSGPDAQKFLDYLVVRDVTKFDVGQIFFTPICTTAGKVITDGLVFRVAENCYRITADPILEWVTTQSKNFNVNITDVTCEHGILSVQGPRSREVLEDVTGGDFSDLDFSRFVKSKIENIDVEICRQGFTGELGYEIWIPWDFDIGDTIWNSFLEKGKQFDIIPAGEWALDVARTEAGLTIPGCDYSNAGPDPSGSHTDTCYEPSRMSSPYEINEGMLVDLGKENDFLGKDTLTLEASDNSSKFELLGLEIDWQSLVELYVDQGIAPTISPHVSWRPRTIMVDEQLTSGWASSITWSPTLKKLIAFGHLERDHAKLGTQVAVDWEIKGGTNGNAPATAVSIPFLQHKRSIT